MLKDRLTKVRQRVLGSASVLHRPLAALRRSRPRGQPELSSGSPEMTIETGSVSPDVQRDPNKRQRIFLISIVIVLFVFGLKVWGREEWTIAQIIVVAATSSLLTYGGLMWAFRFEISRIGYLTVLPQAALFVFGYVLFTELFFFERFVRIYEAVLFGILLLAFLVVLNVVFLTSNVLNVATFRKLPLLQVAQTSSYVITLFYVFFITFFIISIGLHPFITIGLLLCLFFLGAFLHISHLELDAKSVVRYSLALAWLQLLAAFPLLMWPVDTLFQALLPTVMCYMGIGVVMHDLGKMLRPLINWEYSLLVFFVLVVILSDAVWGIGGHIWS